MGQVDTLDTPTSRLMAGKELDLGTEAFTARKKNKGAFDAMTSDLRKMFQSSNDK